VINLNKHLLSPIPVVLILLCLSVAVTGVLGNPANEIIANPAGITPTIDGTINPEEWVTASTVIFNYTTVYAMQDGVNLYLAFDISDNTYSIGDECHILLDVQNDKSSSVQSDDRMLIVKRNDIKMELAGSAGIWLYVTPPYSDWSAAVNSTNDFWQVEYSITYSKINVTAGSTKILGVAFESFDNNVGPMGTTYRWPISSDPNFNTKPNLWGTMTPNEFNWIPEFSNPWILTIIFIATIPTLLYVKARKKLYK
jgi:hypothetical protein